MKPNMLPFATHEEDASVPSSEKFVFSQDTLDKISLALARHAERNTVLNLHPTGTPEQPNSNEADQE